MKHILFLFLLSSCSTIKNPQRYPSAFERVGNVVGVCQNIVNNFISIRNPFTSYDPALYNFNLLPDLITKYKKQIADYNNGQPVTFDTIEINSSLVHKLAFIEAITDFEKFNLKKVSTFVIDGQSYNHSKLAQMIESLNFEQGVSDLQRQKLVSLILLANYPWARYNQLLGSYLPSTMSALIKELFGHHDGGVLNYKVLDDVINAGMLKVLQNGLHRPSNVWEWTFNKTRYLNILRKTTKATLSLWAYLISEEKLFIGINNPFLNFQNKKLSQTVIDKIIFEGILPAQKVIEAELGRSAKTKAATDLLGKLLTVTSAGLITYTAYYFYFEKSSFEDRELIEKVDYYLRSSVADSMLQNAIAKKEIDWSDPDVVYNFRKDKISELENWTNEELHKALADFDQETNGSLYPDPQIEMLDDEELSVGQAESYISNYRKLIFDYAVKDAKEDYATFYEDEDFLNKIATDLELINDIDKLKEIYKLGRKNGLVEKTIKDVIFKLIVSKIESNPVYSQFETNHLDDFQQNFNDIYPFLDEGQWFEFYKNTNERTIKLILLRHFLIRYLQIHAPDQMILSNDIKLIERLLKDFSENTIEEYLGWIIKPQSHPNPEVLNSVIVPQ